MTRRAAFVLLALLALLAVFGAAPARAMRLEEEEALSLGEFDLEQQDAALVASLAEVDAEADAELDLEADAEMEAEAELEAEAEAEAEMETFAPNTIARGKACGTGNKGTCVVSSSCSTNTHERVWNLCVIGNVCCVPKAGSSAAPAKAPAAAPAAAAKAPAAAPAAVATGANGLCGDYASAAVMQRTNNRGQKVNVVAVKREHLTDSSKFGAADTAADNTMLTTTACAYSKLRAAAAQAGHTISINSAFRSLARQQYFWGCYQCKLAKKKNCCNNGNKAAQPGTSNHGMGIALDLQLTTAAYNWMRTNAEKYGFVRTVATEKWHWENRPGTKQSAFFKI